MVRFMIRDVMWLTVVMALALGWGLSYQHWSKTNQLLAADRGIWLTRSIYLKAMFKSLDKQAYDTVWTNDGVTNFKLSLADLERPYLTDRERELVLADEYVPLQ